MATRPNQGLAWESLNLTITELMDYMGDEGPRSKSDLRSFMYDKVGDLATWWFKEGFALAHEICLERNALGDDFDQIRVPSQGAWLTPDRERMIEAKSPSPRHPEPDWEY